MHCRKLKLVGQSLTALLVILFLSHHANAQVSEDGTDVEISESEVRSRLKNLYLQQDEHQIALSIGRLTGNVSIDPRSGSTSKIETASLISRIHYCFFIPQAKWLALGLGSSMGFELRQDLERDLHEGQGFHLPGIMIAANVRFANNWQMLVAIDQVIERWEGFEFMAQSNAENSALEKSQVSVNLRMTDLMISFLRTLDNGWGIQLEAHRRFGRFFRPANAEGFEVDTVMTHQDLWVGTGLTYLIH
jgi:hypothetical protein